MHKPLAAPPPPPLFSLTAATATGAQAVNHLSRDGRHDRYWRSSREIQSEAGARQRRARGDRGNFLLHASLLLSVSLCSSLHQEPGNYQPPNSTSNETNSTKRMFPIRIRDAHVAHSGSENHRKSLNFNEQENRKLQTNYKPTKGPTKLGGKKRQTTSLCLRIIRTIRAQYAPRLRFVSHKNSLVPR
jgi:hypothetical protein